MKLLHVIQMVFEMLLEVPRSGEGLGAEAAWMRFNLLMSHPMVVEVGGCCKALATGLTPVRLLSCVDSPVCVEARAGGEFLGAEVTGVRPLPCVDPDVSLQQAGSVKLLATGVTRQQPLLVTLGPLGFDGQLVLIIQSLHLQVLLLLICGLGHIQAQLTSGGVAASGAQAVPVLLARADCQVHGRVLLQLLQCLHVLLQNDVPQVLQGTLAVLVISQQLLCCAVVKTV